MPVRSSALIGFVRYRAGQYYPPMGSISGVVAPANNSARAMPFWLPRRRLIDRIGVETTVAGEAGSLLRFAVYADRDTDSYPGALLFDAGTVAADGAIGLKEITIAQYVGPGLIWLAVVAQNAVTTRPTMRSIQAGIMQIGSTNGLLSGQSAFNYSNVTGAFPDPWTAAVGLTSGHPVLIRFA